MKYDIAYILANDCMTHWTGKDMEECDHEQISRHSPAISLDRSSKTTWNLNTIWSAAAGNKSESIWKTFISAPEYTGNHKNRNSQLLWCLWPSDSSLSTPGVSMASLLITCTNREQQRLNLYEKKISEARQLIWHSQGSMVRGSLTVCVVKCLIHHRILLPNYTSYPQKQSHINTYILLLQFHILCIQFKMKNCPKMHTFKNQTKKIYEILFGNRKSECSPFRKYIILRLLCTVWQIPELKP